MQEGVRSGSAPSARDCRDKAVRQSRPPRTAANEGRSHATAPACAGTPGPRSEDKATAASPKEAAPTSARLKCARSRPQAGLTARLRGKPSGQAAATPALLRPDEPRRLGPPRLIAA